MSHNSLSIFFTRPIACGLILIAVAMIVVSVASHYRSARREGLKEQEQEEQHDAEN